MDKHEHKLNAISHLDEAIVEKQTQRRIALLDGARKNRIRKRWMVMVGSMAASFALIATTVLLLVTLLGKSVPIYTGMSVSGTPPTGQVSVAYRDSVMQYAAAVQQSSVTGDLAGRPAPADTPFETPLEDKLLVEPSENDCYYAKPGEDVYITVHIDNPDSFEILSFTLNGKKYTIQVKGATAAATRCVVKVTGGDLKINFLRTSKQWHISALSAVWLCGVGDADIDVMNMKEFQL